jgi:hypothetical protein
MSRSKSRCAAVFAALASLAAPADLAAREPDRSRILTRTGSDTVAVLMALNGAQRKLRDHECRKLLTDFRDGEGRSLEENLAPFEAEPADYLAMLVIRDGTGRGGATFCRNPAVAAVTVPKSRLVQVCGASFRLQPSGIRENTLIHEMLHTLGLEENPPSSAEINAQVHRRCGA